MLDKYCGLVLVLVILWGKDDGRFSRNVGRYQESVIISDYIS